MASVQFVFNENLNVSLQRGDTVYYTSTYSAASEFTLAGNNITKIGTVATIQFAPVTDLNGISVNSGVLVTCNLSPDIVEIPTNSFLFFSKNNLVNTSSVKGYFAEVQFKNDSVKKAELFSAACDISESSK
tara:strand:- start:30 stop:422 length:393 start_codon:yes stop_codon:yes gene_type:complete